MRRWWMAVVVVVATLGIRAHAYEQNLTDPDGATLAKILMCNDCKSGVGKGCDDGAEKGWLSAQPCGKCLLESNFGKAIGYPYDLHISGRLTDAGGKGVKERFVKLFLPNGWGVRTRTNDDGTFRMTMGATVERKRPEPLMIDVGTHVDSIKGSEDALFAIYMLPEGYAKCNADAMREAPAKKGAKKDSEKKSTGSKTGTKK